MTDTVGHDDQAHAETAEQGTDHPSSSERIVKWSEQWWAEIANPTARRCTATSNRTGQRCQRAAMDGQRVCGTHGGRAPQAKRKAQQRIAEAADRMARALLKMATDDNTPEHVKLKAITEALDRAGVNSKTAVEVEVSVKPYEQVLEGISAQIEITSRAAYRRSVGTDVPDESSDDGDGDPLAGLIADDMRQAEAHAQRVERIGEQVRANRFVDNDDVIDVSVVDVSGDGHPATSGDHDRQREDDTDGLVRLSPTRPGGPMDQPMTVAEGAELMAEMREREAARRREQGHAVVRSAQRALPRGRT